MRLLFSVPHPGDLLRFSDVVLVFGGESTFVGVVVRLCDPFLPFPSVLGSLLDTIAAIAQPKFFLCLCRFVGLSEFDRIPSTTPGAEPPRDAKDSGSARPHSTHLETSSTNRP